MLIQEKGADFIARVARSSIILFFIALVHVCIGGLHGEKNRKILAFKDLLIALTTGWMQKSCIWREWLVFSIFYC